MVAKIVTGKSLNGILSYNEHKVQKGVAECIDAHLYGAETHELNFYEKLSRLQNLANKNTGVKTHALHISLNFDPYEKPSTTKMKHIAADYMQQIGFGDQPYLVYQHHDAAHPHIHLITTNIKSNGERIDLHNIAKLKSEPARKAIELKYGLVEAESRSQKIIDLIKPVEAIRYGKTETKRAVTNAVSYILKTYNLTSLPEYNAILKQYNIIADRGHQNSRMFKGNGLVYNVLDKNGEQVGASIKASAIYGSPTLKNLEKQFAKNKQKRQPYVEDLKNKIDGVIAANPVFSKRDFSKLLQRQHILIVYRENENGQTYGITYIDQYKKSVINGSELGKAYSAKALTERFSPVDQLGRRFIPQASSHQSYAQPEGQTQTPKASADNTLLQDLLEMQTFQAEPHQFKKRKKRKRQINQ